MMTLEGYDNPDRVLFHYDAGGTARSTAVRVCYVIFGRIRATGSLTTPKRKERGFIHRPGVVWIGQSVLVLPPRDAEELAARLRSLNVRVSMARATVSSAALEAFRQKDFTWSAGFEITAPSSSADTRASGSDALSDGVGTSMISEG